MVDGPAKQAPLRPWLAKRDAPSPNVWSVSGQDYDAEAWLGESLSGLGSGTAPQGVQRSPGDVQESTSVTEEEDASHRSDCSLHRGCDPSRRSNKRSRKLSEPS